MKKNKRPRQTIRSRFILFSLSLALFVILIVIAIVFLDMRKTFSDTTKQYMNSYISYADNQVASRLQNTELLAHGIALDSSIIQKAAIDSPPEASYPWWEEQKKLNSYLSNMKLEKDYISSLALCLDKGGIYQTYGTLLLNRQMNSLREVISGQSRIYELFPDGPDGNIQIVRPLFSGTEDRSFVYVEINSKALFNAYEIAPLEQMDIFVFSPEKHMIYQRSSLSKVSEADLLNISDEFVNVNGTYFFAMRYENPQTNLTTLSLARAEFMYENEKSIIIHMGTVALMAFLLAFLISGLFSRPFFRNLNILMSSMNAVRDGDLNSRAVVKGNDEICDAAGSFNLMMDRMNTLMEEIRVREHEKHQAEQQALLSQIQPHFIYNSISAMKYVAEMEQHNRIAEAATALSELMRGTLGNYEDMVTLWEERTFIEQYIILQRFKYTSQFTLDWEVEEELWTFLIPKLLLQPIVENALLHGLQMRDDGRITVSVGREEEAVVIRVTDNGVGMPEKKVEEIMSIKKQSTVLKNYGINNVRERVRLFYGEKGSFEIFSVQGQFTCVEIKIPFESGEKE